MASSGAIRAGRAFVELFTDNAKLVRGLRQGETQIKAFGKKVSAIGRQMLTTGALAAAPLALATRTFAGFADQMAQVRAVTGSAGEGFRNLTEQAKELGQTTSFTAEQVAGAMTELGRAGFRGGQIQASIDSVLSLARATSTELPRAAEIAAAAMRGFNLGAEDTAMIADILTATANNSAQTLEDLGESFKFVAPLAVEAGSTITETAAALGVLANNGIKGSAAGTALARAYKNIAAGKGSQIFKDLGIQVADSSDNLRAMADILTDLGQRTKGLGSAAKLGIFETIFGRGSAAALKLSGKGQFEGMRKSLNDVTGTAKKTAETMDNVLGGSFRRVTSAVEGVQIAIGEALDPTLQRWSTGIIDAAGATTKWIKENDGIVVSVGKLVVGVLAAGAALVALGAIIKGVGIAAGFAALTLKSVAAAIAFVKVASIAAGAGIQNALIAAFVAIETHPVVAALVAIGFAAAAVATSMGLAATAIKDTTAAAAKQVSQGQELRKNDQLRLDLLKKLAAAGSLDSEQRKAAAKEIETLNDRYGDLGIRMDGLTGKITGVGKAQKKVNALFKEAALLELDAQMLSLNQKFDSLNNKMANSLKIGFFTSSADKDTWVKEIQDQLNVVLTQMKAVSAHRKALTAGDTGALFGAPKSERERLKKDLADPKLSPGGKPNALTAKQQADRKKAVDEAREASERLAQIDKDRAAQSRTDLEQEIHDIQQLRKERMRLISVLIATEKARQGGGRARVLADLEKRKTQALLQGLRDETAAGVAAAEEIARVEQNLREQRFLDEFALNKNIANENARLKIEASLRGHKKAMALLELEKKLALEATKVSGADTDLIKKQFELRKKILNAAQATSQAMTAGTFSGTGLSQLGTGSSDSKRRLKAAELAAAEAAKTAANTKKIERKIKGAVFS